MASQIPGTTLDLLEVSSFVRGYHAYQDLWSPVVNETLLAKREPTNVVDNNAVAIYTEEIVVGHVPHNLAQIFNRFLRRDVNKIFAEITGAKVNRGAGYGLEVPCKYRLYGPKLYIEKAKEYLVSNGLYQAN